MAAKPKHGVEMESYVRLRLTIKEKALLKMAVERLDMTLSDFVRFWCLPAARLVEKGVSPEQFRKEVSETVEYMTLRYQASSLSPSPSPEIPEDEDEE